MARPFSAQEARWLLAEHRNRRQALQHAERAAEEYRTLIPKAGGVIRKKEVQRVLAQIPVEELNRGGQGIRVKTLRDAGLCTLADMQAAGIPQLEALNGISLSGATALHDTVEQLADQAAQGVRIRLSTDDRTPEATALLTAAVQYRHSLVPAQQCSRLLADYSTHIDAALTDLAQAQGGGLSWLFLGREKKQRAESAYEYLSTILNQQYGQQSHEALAQLEAIAAIGPDAVWQEFSTDSIRIFNTLEETAPGLLGPADSVYGLPETLAKTVQEQTLDLEGLRCTLRRYQELGVKYILQQGRVLLGDEMGLGKTVQAIAAMVALRNEGATHFVVVCPASVLTNWCREIRKHSDLCVTKVHGPAREFSLRVWTKAGGVAVTTYETTQYFQLPQDFQFSMLVVDEAHYIKNPKARRTQNVRNISTYAERHLFMTGTALENKVEEMVTLIDMLQPQVAQQVRGMTALAAAPVFREKVAPVYYRRKREDVLTELPEMVETQDWCDLQPAEEAVYDQTVVARNMAAMRRVSWNVPDVNKSSKARRMLEIIDEAKEDGRKVLVFTFFLDTLQRIRTMLGDQCLEPIDGSVPPQRRQEIVDEFKEAPAGTVLAAQIQAGGTGLNIQAASVVILCEPQFKPSIENQAISRAYRMGQTRTVLVHRLLCSDTVDERVTEILARKQIEFDQFADESVAAQGGLELDAQTLSGILEAEVQRVLAKQNAEAAAAAPQPPADAPEAPAIEETAPADPGYLAAQGPEVAAHIRGLEDASPL